MLSSYSTQLAFRPLQNQPLKCLIPCPFPNSKISLPKVPSSFRSKFATFHLHAVCMHGKVACTKSRNILHMSRRWAPWSLVNGQWPSYHSMTLALKVWYIDIDILNVFWMCLVEAWRQFVWSWVAFFIDRWSTYRSLSGREDIVKHMGAKVIVHDIPLQLVCPSISTLFKEGYVGVRIRPRPVRRSQSNLQNAHLPHIGGLAYANGATLVWLIIISLSLFQNLKKHLPWKICL